MKYVTLRKLSLKSRIGFGRNGDLTVQDLINLAKEYELINMYYGLSNISFLDDVLNKIGIYDDLRIEKPGKNISFYKENYDKIYENLHKNRSEAMNAMNKKICINEKNHSKKMTNRYFSRVNSRNADTKRNHGNLNQINKIR
jgi:hypothetical protein